MTTLDMNEIADRLTAAGIPAHVEQMGGGTATIYAGAPGKVIAIGPGWFEDARRAVCEVSDLSIGPEDGMGDVVYMPDPVTCDVVVQWAAALAQGKPTPCTAPGLDCTNEEHGHKVEPGIDDAEQRHTEAGELLCNECGAALFWDERTKRNWHTDPKAAPCFLIQEVR